MDRFLKAKHWQIFSLLIGIPSLIQVAMAITMMSDQELYASGFLMPIISFFYIGIFFGWFWAIGTRLNHLLPENEKVNLKIFKTILTIPIVYLLGISFYLLGVAFGLVESSRPPAFAMFDIMDKVFPLHIISMFSIFYTMWINAKTIRSVELQRPVRFADFAGEFFLIWFYPIGIWILQPKINKLVEMKKAHTANNG